MFENIIYSVELTDQVSNCIFKNISGESYGEDKSFVATLRALLMNRDMHGHSIRFEYKTCDANAIESVMSNLVSDTITYVGVEGFSDEELRLFDEFEAPESFHEHTDIRKFFEKSMNCRVFTQEDERVTLIFVYQTNMRKHHLIQCVMPKLIPWYIDVKTLNADERDLLMSLRDRFTTKYIEMIERICSNSRYKNLRMMQAILNIKKNEAKRVTEMTRRKIIIINDNIERTLSALANYYRDLEHENLCLNGALMSLNAYASDEDSQNIMDFINDTKCIHSVSEIGEDINIVITGYLTIYDPEAYKTLSSNRGSFLWCQEAPAGVFADWQNRKLVLDAIFGDNPIFKIKTYGGYRIIKDGNVSGYARDSMFQQDEKFTHRYPNPHLYHNRCVGSYKQLILEAFSRGDIIGAITHCISSTCSVNVSESATFKHVCEDLFFNNNRILEDWDGKSYTVMEAYQYLKAMEESKE